MQYEFLGNPLYNWLIAAAIVFGTAIFNKLFVVFNKRVIQKITAKTKNRLDDILFKMLQAPFLLGTMLLAIWIAINQLTINKETVLFISNTYRFLVAINITWFMVRLTNAIIIEYLQPIAEDNDSFKRFDKTVFPFVRRTILTFIWIIGVVMALGNIGVDVKALLAGLGIGGLAFALAAQDTLKNVLGGITIFFDRPFRVGDRIVLDKYDGFVEDIGIRSTRIRTLERKLVTVPNYKIVDAYIENVSEEPMRRVLTKLGLTYDTSPEKMKLAVQILKDMPQKVSLIDPKDVYVFFSDFGDFSLGITFIYFIKKESDILDTISKVNFEILESYNSNGLDFAFPTQTIHVEKSEETMIDDKKITNS